jgi:DNA polymerase III gamma/tau subunit
LSPDAHDALLKPMEDCVPGTQDKSLVCLFCTTEPEKMRATILSRCAPAFLIKPVTPEQIADRLTFVCDAEKIPYEKDALTLIGELTECHIRDALKAIEGVSMLGQVNRLNVAKYLHLDSHLLVLEILALILEDLPGALRKTSELLTTTSPTTCYESLTEMAMLAYRVGIGAGTPPSYLDVKVVQEIGTQVGARLLSYASRFSSRPGRPTASMLLCDVAQLHQEAVTPPLLFAQAIIPSTQKPETSDSRGNVRSGDKPKIVDNVYVHPRAVKTVDETALPLLSTPSHELQPLEFFRLVKMRAAELKELKRDGRAGQDDLGSSGANQGG